MKKFNYSPLEIYNTIKNGNCLTIRDLANYYEVSYSQMYYIIKKYELMDYVFKKKYMSYEDNGI